MFNTRSITKVKKEQVSRIFDVINRKNSELDVYVPFPDRETKGRAEYPEAGSA